MSSRPRLFVAAALSLALGLSPVACKQTPQPASPEEPRTVELASEPESPELSAADIEAAVAFLADDAQQGRPPGTEADARVQAWIAERMEVAGLEPGGDEGSFVQSFSVGDGVRLREGATSSLADKKGAEIPHAIVPFGHDTGEAPVEAPLVFVGHGIASSEDPGDYEGIEGRVKGAIVVALAGSDDPHAAPAKTRPQSKLIAARDRGAVGFVLWDPQSDVPWPNHGPYSELDIPAAHVGKAGSEAMRKALRVRGEKEPKLGARSRASFKLHTPIEAVTLDTANVVGVLPGSSPAAERMRVYVGAHMDHLGMGTSSSLAPGERAVHNGADDNASGVAVILELAEGLAAIPPEHRPHDLVFVAFGAEEMGLLGSKALVEALDDESRGRILAMLNFDMVGRLRDKLILNGLGTAEEWLALIEAANGAPAELTDAKPAHGHGAAAEADSEAEAEAGEAKTEAGASLTIRGQADGWGPSDHASFYGEGVPVLHFFTGAHEDYHKPSDDIDKLDAEGAAAIGELAGRIILGLMDQCEPLSYVKVERPKAGRTRFKVSLGTMPDYGAGVDGLALAGVREGGPAAAAGLQKGDVIKRIGEREIHNIDDFMAAFGELEPGVEVEVGFERAGKLETTKMTPAAPR